MRVMLGLRKQYFPPFTNNPAPNSRPLQETHCQHGIYLSTIQANLSLSSHENPVIFYSIVIGAVGPVMVVAVPPIRSYFGYRPSEIVPTSYPVPNRPRRPVQGYEDE
ncbi:hypothetical protein BD779DRAFT_582404 [Infundibulicybe gibba]|nr:hypothetical protein BD779DRAFT_582404 [Infundibulicybe gibba]